MSKLIQEDSIDIWDEVIHGLGETLGQYLYDNKLSIEDASEGMERMGGTNFRGKDLERIYTVAGNVLKALKEKAYLEEVLTYDFEFEAIDNTAMFYEIFFEGNNIGTVQIQDNILRYRLTRKLESKLICSLIIKTNNLNDYKDVDVKIEYCCINSNTGLVPI